MQKVYVATDPHEKAMQRALIQYRNPKNFHLVHEALKAAHREDLIGSGPKCLVRDKMPKEFRNAPAPRPPKKKDTRTPSGTARGAAPQKKTPPAAKPTKRSSSKPTSRRGR